MKSNFYTSLLVLIIFPFIDKIANAQIIPDNTLPNNSHVPQGCTVCEINGGTTRGVNLYHSFQRFSIPTNGRALFNNSLNIENIFTRVTGKFLSNIDGLIRTNGNANLFLINPNGIIFGENARLNIGGSFIPSTANSIKFVDGTEFNTQTSQNTPLLTINTPIGLQFGKNPGNIQVQTKNGLQIQPNQTLALVGGDISFQGGKIKTNGGRLELSSVKAEKLVNLTATNQGFLLNYDDINNFGSITLTGGTRLNTSNIANSEMKNAGDIIINTNSLRLDNGSQISTSTSSTGQAGNVMVNAADIQIIGLDENGFPSGIFAGASLEAMGSAGNLTINTKTLLLQDGGIISASTFGEDNTTTLIQDGGTVPVVGRAGNLTVNAADIQIIGNRSNTLFPSGLFASGSSPVGEVQASLTINTNTLKLLNGGVISASNLGTGNGGNLIVNASDIQIIGTRNDQRQSSGLFAISTGQATGEGGKLIINTNNLLLQDGGEIAAATAGSGNAGSIIINASDIKLINNNNDVMSRLSAISGLTATGSAGDIQINTNTLYIYNGAGITVEAQNQGNAGNLSIDAKHIFLDNSATITANTRSNNTEIKQQASINLNSQDLIMRRGSSITTNATGNNVNGGNIIINTDVLAALENSDISANSTGSRGGRVTITAQGIFGTESRLKPTPESDITATGANPELSGTVQINRLSVDPNQGLINLSTGIIDTENQLVQGCAASNKFTDHQFTIIGRAGLPSSPNDLLTEVNPLVNLVELVPNQTNSKNIQLEVASNNLPTKIVEAQGWVVDAQGNVLLVAQVANFVSNTLILSPVYCP